MKDYLVLRDWESDFIEVLLFDDYLTNGDTQRIKEAVQFVKDNNELYTNDDIKEKIYETKPYTECITVSDSHCVIEY